MAVQLNTDGYPRATYRADQVRELDRLAIASGPSDFELMCRAGEAAFAELRCRWPEAAAVEVYCGGGNNGGDGYIVAALAAQQGMAVRCRSLKSELQGAALRAAARARSAGVAIVAWSDGQAAPAENAVIVDALLGIGVSGELRLNYRQAIAQINGSACPVLSIDMPSGLNADTGMPCGDAVRADATITFIGLKQGLCTGLAGDMLGELVFDDLGVPGEVYQRVLPSAERIDGRALLRGWGQRPASSHKGQSGHVLVAGGDLGMAGAALLASSAAARSGAGLVSCLSRPEHISVIVGARPEVMAHGVGQGEEAAELAQRASVIALGPGLGKQGWGESLWRTLIGVDCPLVLDADGLNILAEYPDAIAARAAPLVITPHPGEAARLLGCSVAEIQGDRFGAVVALAEKYAAVALLKGVGTLVHGAGRTWINATGNPGMASGGMGDVLTGIIAALIAQGLTAEQACCLAAAVHGSAADRAAIQGQRGLLASDVINELRGVINAV